MNPSQVTSSSKSLTHPRHRGPDQAHPSHAGSPAPTRQHHHRPLHPLAPPDHPDLPGQTQAMAPGTPRSQDLNRTPEQGTQHTPGPLPGRHTAPDRARASTPPPRRQTGSGHPLPSTQSAGNSPSSRPHHPAPRLQDTRPCKSHRNGSNPNFQPPLEFRPTQNIAKKLHIPMTRTPPIPPKTPFLENRPTPPIAESYRSYHPR